MAETTEQSWTHERVVAEGLDPKCCEIVDGSLVTREPCGMRGGAVQAELARLLTEHVAGCAAGQVYLFSRFALRKEPRIEHRPDLAFLSEDRRPPARFFGPFEGAPDLAVEVLSPTDSTNAMHAKARRYLAHGCREVWIVDPALETVTVVRSGRPTASFSHGDVLSSDVLTELGLPIASLFGA